MEKFIVNKNKEVVAENPADVKKQKKILNSKYLNRLREEGEGLPELRVG